MSITHHQSFHAISNTEGTQFPNEDSTITTIFEATPKMSTYLLAFVVSEFKFESNEAEKEVGETLQRVFARPDEVHKTRGALENSIKVLKKLEEYVGLDYELAKMDSAAVPQKGGAMENWGLITYRFENDFFFMFAILPPLSFL